MLDLVPLHGTANEIRIGFLDQFRREFFLEQSIICRVVRPYAYVRGISLVARARMRDVANQSTYAAHAVSMLTVGRTRSRSISTERVTTLGTMVPRKPPPPAGPQHKSDSTSQSISSASSRFGERRLTCRRTSCVSVVLS